MASNAYLATDNEKLMKVGKSNNPKRREKQIDLTITLTVACLDEMSAYRIEDQLRQFIAERGGIKHASTVDWFAFDPQIYRMVCEFAANLDGYKAISEEESQDAEIDVLRRRYFKLIAEARNTDTKEGQLRAEKKSLENELNFLQERYQSLREELQEQHEKHGKLNREFGYMEGRILGFKKWVQKKGTETIDTETLLEFLNSLVPEDVE